MLRNFAAALLATALIAGPAFAAQPAGDKGTTPGAAAPAVQAPTKSDMRTPSKAVGQVHKHKRKHVAHRNTRTTTLAHVKATKSHRGHVAHIATPANGAATARVQTAKLPAAQSISR